MSASRFLDALRELAAGLLLGLAIGVCFLVFVLFSAPASAQGGPPPPVAPVVGSWQLQFPEGELLVSSGPHIRCYGTPLEDWRDWYDARNCYGDPYGTEAEPAVYPCSGEYLDLVPSEWNGGGCWTYGLTPEEAECVANPVWDWETYTPTYGELCVNAAEPEPEPPAEPADLAAVAAAASAAAQAAAEAAAAAAGLRSDLTVAFWCACGALGFFGYSVGARDA